MKPTKFIRSRTLGRLASAALATALFAAPAAGFAAKIKMTTPPLYLFGSSGVFVNYVTCTAGNSGTAKLDVKVSATFYNDDELASVNGMSPDSVAAKRRIQLKPGQVTTLKVPQGLRTLDSIVARCQITYDGQAGDVQGAIVVEDSLNARGSISLPARMTPY